MKKKTFLLALLVSISLAAVAQEDTVKTWTKGGFISLTFNQVSMTNWSGGGENSLSGTASANLFANYKKDKSVWDNSLDLGYGTIRSNKQMRKNEDKMDLNSKYGYMAVEKLYYSALVNFKSQFTNGYNYPNDSVVVSKFMSPAYLLVSAGMDYKPVDYFSLFVSPATGKFTFFMDDAIDEVVYGLDSGKTVRSEFGAYISATFQKDVIKNVNVKTKLDLFNNYTDSDKGNRKNIDVNWETHVNMKINSYLSASLFTHLIYDHDILIPIDDNDDGEPDRSGRRTQFKEVFGVSFSYKF